MAGYLSIVTVKGHKYYRLVESYRENGKVKHRILVNYGSTPPEGISATVVRATKRKAVDNVALTAFSPLISATNSGETTANVSVVIFSPP